MNPHPLHFVFASVLAVAVAASAATAATLPRDLPDLNLRTSGYVSMMASQPDGKLIVAGNFSEIGDAGASILARIGVDGSLDTTWMPQSRYPVSAFAVSDDGNLYVGNALGGVVKIPLAGNGALDVGFDFPDVWDVADAIVVEGGYVYVATAGDLRRYFAATGVPDSAWIGAEEARTLICDHAGHLYTGVTRVNIADGSVDATWTAPSVFGGIHATALSGDGYLYVASDGDVGGIPGGLARLPLSAHGAPDAAWRPLASSGPPATYVRALLPADDGSVIVAGDFTAIGGLARANVARLAGANGTADVDWRADADGLVSSLSRDPNGAVIAAGAFARIDTAPRASVARLGSDGTPDASFAAGVYDVASVKAIVPDPTSGHLYIGGRFDWVGTERHRNVLRLDASGHLDAAWAPDMDAPPPPLGASWDTSGIHAIAVRGSHVYLGGFFSSIDGIARNALARVEAVAPGRLDVSWDPALHGIYFNADSTVSWIDTMIVDGQNRLVVGGDFRSVGDSGPAALARFGADGRVDSAWRPAVEYPVTRIADDGAGNLYVITSDPQYGRSTPHKVSTNTGESDTAWEQAASLEAAFDIIVAGPDDLLIAGGITFADTRVLRISRQTGAIDTDWTPITSCFVRRLVLDGTYLYAAGSDFSGSDYRACVQRIDAGGVLDPSFAPAWTDGSDTRTLAIAGGAIYVGGVFDHVGEVARRALVAFESVDELFEGSFEE